MVFLNPQERQFAPRPESVAEVRAFVRAAIADTAVDELDPLASGGRGMLIVERCATDWGVERYPDDGKSVWFEYRQPDL